MFQLGSDTKTKSSSFDLRQQSYLLGIKRLLNNVYFMKVSWSHQNILWKLNVCFDCFLLTKEKTLHIKKQPFYTRSQLLHLSTPNKPYRSIYLIFTVLKWTKASENV